MGVAQQDTQRDHKISWRNNIFVFCLLWIFSCPDGQSRHSISRYLSRFWLMDVNNVPQNVIHIVDDAYVSPDRNITMLRRRGRQPAREIVGNAWVR
jgi:hypothetical protein